MFDEIMKALKKHADPEKAKLLQGFFKTGPGEYGEGDIFIGVKVPESRKVAKQFRDASRATILKLLKSKIHEHRLTGLLILVQQYQHGDESRKQDIMKFYLSHTRYVNNWDLVDLTAPKILGDWCLRHGTKPLYDLAKSDVLWEKRIAIVATATLIDARRFRDTLKLSKKFLTEEHDLMHKACGWMLREVGKKDMEVLRAFLDEHLHDMPRTMLRYSIERFPEKERKKILKK